MFSEFTQTLQTIEFFLKSISKQRKYADAEERGLASFSGKWKKDLDFCSLDGDSTPAERQELVTNFNDPNNSRLRLFLLSSKAGGEGINLQSANKCVIFDISWNPTTELQCLHRIYRLGQMKPCTIYRLVAVGTMEEKIYERSISKQALTQRVVDNKDVQRLYNLSELKNLYQLVTPNFAEKPVQDAPDDSIMKRLLEDCANIIYK